MNNKLESGSEFTPVDKELSSQEKEKTIESQLGHKPSDFELELLAHPGDKDEKKRMAVEEMFNSGVDAPISILGEIKDKTQQKEINRLAVEFKEAMKFPKDSLELAELRKRQKEIRAQLQKIIDEAMEAA